MAKPRSIRVPGTFFSVNAQTGLYELKEGGVIYSMTLELTRRYNQWRRILLNTGQQYKGFMQFYEDLSREERISAVVPKCKLPDEFYSDAEAED